MEILWSLSPRFPYFCAWFYRSCQKFHKRNSWIYILSTQLLGYMLKGNISWPVAVILSTFNWKWGKKIDFLSLSHTHTHSQNNSNKTHNKVKVDPGNAIKTQRGRRGITPPISLDGRWVVNIMPRSVLPPGNNPSTLWKKAGWASELV
jgi:hypothetical protein